ncbi:CopG family ribbon-helix-helix protein [Candidatus Methanomethylophilus sp. 1R26]
MEGVTRIGVSLEPDLLAEFDKIIAKKDMSAGPRPSATW